MKKCSHSSHHALAEMNITPLLDLAFVLQATQHLAQRCAIGILEPERACDFAHAGLAFVPADEGEQVFARRKAGRPGFLGWFLQDDAKVGPGWRNRQPEIIRPP